MGFEPIADKDGRLSKMLVRKLPVNPVAVRFDNSYLGAQSGDVHCVSFDEGRKSNTDYTELLWRLASS
jgi:kinetochore protein Spc24